MTRFSRHLPAYLAGSLALTATLVVLSACSSPGAAAPTSAASSPAASEQSVSGDIPDNQVFIEVTGKSGAFAVKVPEGWASSSAGGATTYTDKLNSIVFEQSAVNSAASVDSVTAQLGQLESGHMNPTGGAVTSVSTTSGDAIHVQYEADSPADSVTGKVHRDAIEVYLFAKSGQQVALTLEGPTTADNVDPWKIVSDSFRWTA